MIPPAVVGGNTSTDFLTLLNDLSTPLPYQAVGGQNFTRCCLQAVRDWTQGNPAIMIQSSQSPYNNFTLSPAFSDSGEQFPCGAVYTDDPNGAPQILISNDWYSSNCGGWQQSGSSKLTQWVQPFVGFILPAAAFCLNVRKLPVSLVFIRHGLTVAVCIYSGSPQDDHPGFEPPFRS